MRFSEYTEEQQKNLIKEFINKLILSLNAKYLTADEVKTLNELMCNWIVSTNFRDYRLESIYDEIVSNYKQYTPLCFASIKTANHKLNV